MSTSTRRAQAPWLRAGRLDRRWFTFGLIAVAALYVVVRLLVLWRFPPYYDEGFYGQAAWYAFGHPEARFIALRDNKGPLLTWLAFIPLKLDRDAMLLPVRLVAAAAGLISLIALGALARQFVDRVVALTAMALFALLPFVVVQTSMGIHEPLIMATGTIALLLQVRLAREPRLDTGLLLGFALAAGMLTKASGVYALILLPLSLLVFDWRADERRARLVRWIGCVAAALTIVLMGEALVRMSGDFYAAESDLSAAHQFNTPSYALAHLGSVLAENWPPYRVQLAGYITVPLVLLAGVGIAVSFARRPNAAVLLLAWLCLPIAISVLIANKPLARYLLPAMPEVALAASIGLVATARALSVRLRSRPRIAALSALGIVAIVPALMFDIRFVTSPGTAKLPGFDDRELLADASSGNGWPQLGRQLARHVQGKPQVVTISGIPNEIVPSLASYQGELAPITTVQVGDPRSSGSRFFVENGGPPPGPGYRLLWSFQRPRGGVPLRLYERT